MQSLCIGLHTASRRLTNSGSTLACKRPLENGGLTYLMAFGYTSADNPRFGGKHLVVPGNPIIHSTLDPGLSDSLQAVRRPTMLRRPAVTGCHLAEPGCLTAGPVGFLRVPDQ